MADPSLIAADNIAALAAALAGVAWFGFWIDSKPIGKKIPGVVVVLTTAMILSNAGLIPFSAPTYNFVFSVLMPLAIPMLLFKADLRKIFSESGIVALTFTVASIATAAAAVVGFYLFPLGDTGAQVAGMYTGGWIGGAVNQLAVSQAVGLEGDSFSIAVGASSPVSNIALLLLVLIPASSFLLRHIPSKTIENAQAAEKLDMGQDVIPPLHVTHLIGIIAISFVICAVAAYIGDITEKPHYTILIISMIAIALANLFPGACSNLKGDFELGLIFMYLFFAAVGAGTSATSFMEQAMNLFAYGLFIIVVHLLIVLIVAKLAKFDLADAITGSAAALVGPAVTAAICTAQGWRHLVTPGILCGILGYAIGTFVGIGITKLLG